MSAARGLPVQPALAPGERAPGLAAQLVTLIEACLSLDPGQRPTIGEFLAALERQP